MNVLFNVPESTFRDEYLYQKPFVFRGAAKSVDLSWSDINEIYSRADVADKSFKLMNGYEVPKSEYIESHFNVGEVEHRLVKPVVYDYMRGGATLVYNRIRNEPIVTRLSNEIAAYVGAQTIVSGYAAFSGKSSYKSHWDTRDVFAIQLLGRKRWIVKQPNFKLPLYVQQTKNMPGFFEPEEVYLDVILEPGDIIYVPRGWWHNPLPVGGETFHLAVGTFAPTGFDYLRWLVGLSPNAFAVRNNLHEFERDIALLEEIARDVADLIKSKEVFEGFLKYYIGQQRVDSKISLDVLGDGKKNKLMPAQRIRLNANLLYYFSEGFLIVNGGKVNVDDVSLKLIHYIFNVGECDVANIEKRFPEHASGVVNTLLFQLGVSDVVELVS